MLYSTSHEWIEIDSATGIGTVGITNYALRELGEIVHVGLPRLNQKIIARGEVAVLESTKSAVDVYSPVSGIIVRVNESLLEDLSSLNQAAERDGWLYQILLEDVKELDLLLSRARYESLVI